MSGASSPAQVYPAMQAAVPGITCLKLLREIIREAEASHGLDSAKPRFIPGEDEVFSEKICGLKRPTYGDYWAIHDSVRDIIVVSCT